MGGDTPYHGILPWVLVVLCQWTVVNGLMDYTTEKCATGGHLGELNHDPDVGLTLYYDIVFTCEGTVAKWEFFATETGTFYASVWRIDQAKGEVRLIGKSKLEAKEKGYNFEDLKEHERIPVEPGDLIGTHYKHSGDKAVISWETDQKKRTHDARDLSLSRFKFIASMTESKLKVGRILSKSEGEGKLILPAVRARVYGFTDNLRIVGGPIDGKGRPEMFMEGTWGTICDRWYHRYGWPNVFCYEMGYPGSKSAMHCDKMGQDYVSDLTVPIHFESPKCKVSLNVTIFQCWIHPKGDCAHDKDICIECHPKIKLVGDKCTKMRGIPVIYHNGYWGTICDTRSPAEHMANLENSWTTAFCRQLGFDGVKKIKLAVEKMDDYDSEYPVGIHSPECGVVNPTVMAECPHSVPNSDCDHTNDYYIKCFIDGNTEEDDLDQGT